MSYLNVDFSNTKNFVNDEKFNELTIKAKEAYDTLHKKNGLGNDFLGWLDLPINYDKEEMDEIIKAAKKIKETSDVLVVIGIGGSYLGAKAAIEMFKKYFKNNELEIIFVGNNISSTYLAELMDYLKDKRFSINVISKSGTTTEPAIAFRALKNLLPKKEIKDRIYATTDEFKGALHDLALSEGYKMFKVPDDIGGRFSVLTAVGMLPISCICDPLKIMEGAKKAYNELYDFDNDCTKYAILRNLFYNDGKWVEIFVNHEPKMLYFTEWLKQLFAESEGKGHKGIFPTGALFSTDLHSIGQYIQDGKRIMFETVINIVNPERDVVIEEEKENIDGLNYLKGKTVDFVNKQAVNGTIDAHVFGKVPVIKINVSKIDEETFGYLVYFFEKACGISAYMLKVNPFDQPGVELYKKNMFHLLGKPGY